MHKLGLKKVTVTPSTLLLTEYGAAELVLELIRVAERAREAGVISEQERAAWIGDLRKRDEANAFFVAVTGFITSAEKNAPSQAAATTGAGTAPGRSPSPCDRDAAR